MQAWTHTPCHSGDSAGPSCHLATGAFGDVWLGCWMYCSVCRSPGSCELRSETKRVPHRIITAYSLSLCCIINVPTTLTQSNTNIHYKYTHYVKFNVFFLVYDTMKSGWCSLMFRMKVLLLSLRKNILLPCILLVFELHSQVKIGRKLWLYFKFSGSLKTHTHIYIYI
jgi:hypothetical protein